MLLDPPMKVSQDHISIDVREIEPLLQGPALPMNRWPGATIKLNDGRTMYIREATLEEAPALMDYMKKVMEADHDFYDVVGAQRLRRDRRLVPQAAEGPIYPRRAHRRAVGGFLQRPAHERGHQHQPAHDGARPWQPHRGDHVLRQDLLRLRGPREQGVLGDVRELQRLAPLGPRHGPTQLPVAGCPA